MGTKNEPGQFDCYDAAEDDEPMFVLLARDPLAPELVRQWAKGRMRTGVGIKNQNKCEEALQCAEAMEAWQKKNAQKKTQ